jgi:NAD(P)-dependent dehydrogenase (short-subunit alcohol dehydrogenase family)
MSRVLIVTGGSRGIGAATARLAADDGWTVVLTYRSEEKAARNVVDEITQAGGTAQAMRVDVSEEDEVVRLFNDCQDRHRRLDGLVNNAGILPPIGSLKDISTERWTRTLTINTTGVFLCCREAIKSMARGGSIVNVSSMAAPLGAPNEFLDYAASKGAVESMTIGLAKEMGPVGIRVNAVRPGLITTDIHQSAGDAGRVERLAVSVPLRRAGTPEETAAAIVWLLSDAAAYVTGSILPVSGGR